MAKLLCGPCWRIAPNGTAQVYLGGYSADGTEATVYSRGVKSRWAQRPMQVSADNVFADRATARAEYRRRVLLVREYPTQHPNVEDVRNPP